MEVSIFVIFGLLAELIVVVIIIFVIIKKKKAKKHKEDLDLLDEDDV